MDEKHYVIVVGARPNFIKLSAFLLEARKHPKFKFTVIHTGQHYDDAMSKVFFDEFQIPKPDYELRDAPLGTTIKSIQDIIGKYEICAGVIVFGDTRSSLAGALAAKGLYLKLIHIEAGLRSNDSRMPEETNRVVIDHLSDLLFTTEDSAVENLQNEGFDMDTVVPVGNLMLETLENFHSVLKTTQPGRVIVTIHRAENTCDERKLENIMNMVQEIPEALLVLHPGTKRKLEEFGISTSGVETVAPLGYLEFMGLLAFSKGVITDSGGIQEEANYLGIPCATLRDNTERPGTLSGSNKLFAINGLISGMLEHLNTKFSAKKEDTKVAEKILKYL